MASATIRSRLSGGDGASRAARAAGRNHTSPADPERFAPNSSPSSSWQSRV